jgi:hypothetical protein
MELGRRGTDAGCSAPTARSLEKAAEAMRRMASLSPVDSSHRCRRFSTFVDQRRYAVSSLVRDVRDDSILLSSWIMVAFAIRCPEYCSDKGHRSGSCSHAEWSSPCSPTSCLGTAIGSRNGKPQGKNRLLLLPHLCHVR